MAIRLGANLWNEELLTYTDVNDTFNKAIGFLGEIRQFCPSITNAESISTMRGYGWAVCDGTTPATQGISNPVITTTPDLTSKFLYGDATTSGTTGGSATNTHNHTITRYSHGMDQGSTLQLGASSINDSTINIIPPYYTVVFMIKVK